MAEINLTIDKDKAMRVASIVIGLFISVILLIVGFQVLSGKFSRAVVKISGVTADEVNQNSFRIIFNTNSDSVSASECNAFIGTNVSELTSIAPCVPQGPSIEEGGQAMSCLADLKAPGTTYYFIAKCKGDDEGMGAAPGVAASVTTLTNSIESKVNTTTRPLVDPAAVEPTSRPQANTEPKDCNDFIEEGNTRAWAKCVREPSENDRPSNTDLISAPTITPDL